LGEPKRTAGRPALTDDQLRQRKRVILGDALILVAEKGADSVRLRDVALRTGVSVGALQHYFDSRDQLIREAFDQHARDVVDSIAKASDPAAEPWERLVAVLDAAVMRPDFSKRCVLWMEFAAASQHDGQLRALLDGAYEAWRRLLGDIVDSGIEARAFQPSLPSQSVVTCLLALIDGLELAGAIQVHGATPVAIFETLKDAARLLLQPTANLSR
jgi:AcrR family transcriptional regulator